MANVPIRDIGRRRSTSGLSGACAAKGSVKFRRGARASQLRHYLMRPLTRPVPARMP